MKQRLLAFSSDAAAEVPKKAKRGRRLFFVTAFGGAVAGGGFAVSRYYRDKQSKRAAEAIKNARTGRVSTREENLEKMASGKEFDVLVVGGGATGAGVALEAQLRGLSVACLEQEDFASGTSSKSTKLLWAGSRYLVIALVKLFSPGTLADPVTAWENFKGSWHMVMGCFRERTYMLTMNPHITNWVPIAVPLDKWILWPPPFNYPPAAVGPATGMFVAFFKFYDALSNWVAPSSFVMTSARTQMEFPQMDAQRMKYVSVFYEGAHNDARTNVAIALTAAMHGACMTNYTQVTKILFDQDGKANGVMAVDRTQDGAKPFTVKAKKVIYCGGPFTDEMRQLSEGDDVKKVVNGSGGTHIVLPPYYCPRHMGMVDMATSRGSFMFFLPWEGYTLVGTTDVKTKPDLHHEVPEDEIQYLINECEKYLSPDLQVRRRDVMSAWYGIRPLAGDPNATDQSAASRDHVVSHHPTNNITFVAGGKWTTWREMAEDAVDRVLDIAPELKKKAGPSITLETPLIGTGRTDEFPEGWNENVAVRLSQSYDLAFDVAQHLARNYGTHAPDVLKCVGKDEVKGSRSGLYKHYPRLYEGAAASTGYPYLEAEVRYAVEKEYARKPADVLGRRTRLAYLNSTAARLALPKVVQIMGESLGWDAARQRREMEEAEAVMSRDFAGPVPNKTSAKIRNACAADVKDIFDSIDTNKRGTLSKEGIGNAAQKLGFPLATQELDSAMQEMGSNGSGEVGFPQFLMWWNSSKESESTRQAIYMATQEKWDKESSLHRTVSGQGL